MIKNKKIKICFVFTFPVPSAKGDFLTTIPVRMKKLMGDKVELYTLYSGVLNEDILTRNGIKSCKIKISNFARFPLILRCFLLSFAVYSFAKREKIDIFTNANNHYYLFFAGLGAKLAGAKVIGRVTGIMLAPPKSGLKKKLRKKTAIILERLSINISDSIFALSCDLRNTLIKRGNHEDKIRVISTGIDVDKFCIRPLEKIRSRPRRLLYVGRIDTNKGLEYAIKAFLVVKDKFSNIEFVICGNGDYKEKLKSWHSQKDNIIYMDYISHERLPDIYRNSDILILPSFSEGLPNVILEAMACGVPVIATKVGEIPLLLNEGRRGVLIDPGNVEHIVNGIGKFITDEEFRFDCVKDSRRYVEENHSFKVVRGKYSDLFKSTLNRNHGKR